MKKILYIITFLFLTILLLIFFGETCEADESTKLYQSQKYRISLYYNSTWKPNPNYTERYEGPDGFFMINALRGDATSIDIVVNYEVNQKLKPYGSAPQIISTIIDGEEAKLILPSKDQDPDFRNQAELIVRYPTPISINDNTYNYFVLYSDVNNIKNIGSTIKFFR